jgi:hypothetical protein
MLQKLVKDQGGTTAGAEAKELLEQFKSEESGAKSGGAGNGSAGATNTGN